MTRERFGAILTVCFMLVTACFAGLLFVAMTFPAWWQDFMSDHVVWRALLMTTWTAYTLLILRPVLIGAIRRGGRIAAEIAEERKNQ